MSGLQLRANPQARRLAWSASPSTSIVRRAKVPTADRSMTPDGARKGSTELDCHTPITEALVPKFGVEALAVAILPRAASLDVSGSRPHGCDPQSILRRNISDPRAGMKTLGHSPRLENIRPTPTVGWAIKDLDSGYSLRSTHLHPMLVLVLPGKPPANSLAGRHARCRIRPQPRAWRTVCGRPLECKRF